MSLRERQYEAGFEYSAWARKLCTVVVMVLLVPPSLAGQLSDTEAVEAGREALDGAARFPWYDSDSDGIRRFDVEPPADLKNRGSKWERRIKPKNLTPWSMPVWLWTVLEVLGWTLLVMALVAVGYFLVRAFLIAETGHANGGSFTEGVLGPGDADRVESLPFQLKAPQTDLLSEARRHYEAGNYKDAIIYLYSYQLVELDKHQLIRLTKGKTNRQYLREVRRRGDLFSSLRTTMYAFEDVFFGNHALDRGRFESCWSGLDLFRQSLEQATV
ncbi:MAG: DUF4129 domain-containing protein [Planctomycetes bacterium]|nr:DUF4129 domain-containing protein [Planctomycetota bacterium]